MTPWNGRVYLAPPAQWNLLRRLCKTVSRPVSRGRPPQPSAARMRSYLRFPLLALLAAAAACRPPAPGSAPAPEEPAYRGPLVSSLQVEPGADSVRFVMQVTNPTTAPLRLSYTSGMTHDFTVRDGAREVWRWSADRSFVQSLVSISLGAGETRSYTAVWRPAPALRGRRLTAEGRLTATEHPVRQSTPFALP